MWLALVLPLLVLPALVGFSRFEQRIMGGTSSASSSTVEPVRVADPAVPRR